MARAAGDDLPRIAFLGGASAQSYAGLLAAFQRGLGEGGYVDGRNVTIDYRWADNQQDRLPVLAAELARRQPAVIVAGETRRRLRRERRPRRSRSSSPPTATP